MPQEVIEKDVAVADVIDEAQKLLDDIRTQHKNGELTDEEFDTQWKEAVENLVTERLSQEKVDRGSNLRTSASAFSTIKWVSQTGTADMKAEVTTDHFLKAVMQSEAIPGAPTDASPVWYQAFEANPFMILPEILVAGDTWNVSELTPGSFVRKQSIDASPTYSGVLTEGVGVVEYVENRLRASLPALADHPGLRARVISSFIDSYQEARGARIFEIIKGRVGETGGYSSVATGQANSLPAVNAILGKLREMFLAVDTKYKMSTQGICVFVISSQVFDLLQQITSGSGEWGLRPIVLGADGVLRLWRYPLLVSDLLDIGTVNDEIPALFGNLHHAVELARREHLQILESPATLQGTMSYLAYARHGAAQRDGNALVALKVGAS